MPGSERKMDPKPVVIRENYKGSDNAKEIDNLHLTEHFRYMKNILIPNQTK